jgi:hypothetical protein
MTTPIKLVSRFQQEGSTYFISKFNSIRQSLAHQQYSGSSDKHSDLHSCDVDARCYTGAQHRKLKPSDWVKFGNGLALGRSGGRQEDIIARYIEAWRELYGTEPPMIQGDSFPKSFLDDPQYQPDHTPWFSQENSGAGIEGQEPVAGPSTSTSGSTSKSNPSPDSPDHEPSALMRHLKEDHFFVEMSYPTPGIKGGFHEGYADHVGSAVQEKVRAIFIIIPWHHLRRDYQHSIAICSVPIGQSDYDKISRVCPKAIYKDRDKKACTEGQVYCFVDSWVRSESALIFLA